VCRYGWFAPGNSRSLQEPPDGLLSFYFRSKYCSHEQHFICTSMSGTAKKDLIEAITALIKERRSCAQLLSNLTNVARMKQQWPDLSNFKPRLKR
jgi:hypothetical protein